MTRAPKKAPPRPSKVTALAIPERPPLAVRAPPILTPAGKEILGDWLIGKSSDTRATYMEAARHFAQWLVAGGHAPERGHWWDMIADALQVRRVEGNLLAKRWVQSQVAAGTRDPSRPTADSTIATRCSAVRLLCQKLADVEMIGYVPTFPAPKRRRRGAQDAARKYEGVPAAFMKVARGLERLATRKRAAVEDVRDWALVRMGSDMGLRRGELLSTDVEHLDLGGRFAMVLGKGRKSRERMTLPPPLVPVLQRWLRARASVASATGPLFVSLGDGHGARSSRGGRIRDRTTINRMLRRRADQFGVTLAPHDLRRVFCTETLRQYGADRALPLTRHASVDTLGLYDLEQGKGVAAMADAVGGAIDKMLHAGQRGKGRKR